MEKERIAEIERVICNEMDITLEMFHSKNRYGNLPTARFMAWHIFKSLRIFKTYQKIAQHYGYKQHCSILHGIKSLNGRMEIEKELRESFTKIKNKIKMNVFNNTHQMKLTLREQNENNEISFNRYDAPVEIDDDGEINSLALIPRVKEHKIEPMDDYPTFYTTTLYDLAKAGYFIEFTPINY